jgi:serine/threonine protein kinase
MGTVYRARDPILDRLVALKTVAPALLSNAETRARFQREARAAARLQHPGIVTIYDLGEVEGTLYIAMELLEGVDLAEAMSPPDRLTLPQKLRIVVEVCRGLDFAHKHGVFHRDVKPANIRLLRDGRVKIVDFGIARLENSTMTQTGLVLGTPSYMAPEVLKGGRVDHRADMWAVGIVLFELLAGIRPFDAPTIAGVIYNIVHQEPPILDAPSLGLPVGISAIVERALAKDPAARYRDMGEMADAIQTVLGMTPSGERPLSAEAREHAYRMCFAEARRLLAENDLEGSLNAARRAQALEPSRSGIVALVKQLEERLQDSPTISTATPVPSLDLSLIPIDEPTPREGAMALPGTPPAVRASRVLERLRARDASAFRELGIFGEPPSTVTACPAPGRDLLATAGTDGAVRIWDLRSRTRSITLRTLLHERSGHDAVAVALAFSPTGALMASGHVDGNVHLWDLKRCQELPCRLRHEESVGCVAFSPDGGTLASGGLDSNLKLWDVAAACSGEGRRELFRQPAGVTAVAFAGDGTWILTGHTNRVLRLIDTRTGRLLATLRGPEGLVNLLSLSPDGRHLAVCSHDRTLRVFDMAERSQLFALLAHRSRNTTSIAFFSDGAHLATVAQDNAVQFWDLESRSPIAALWGREDECFAGIALFGGGDHVAVALADGRIRLWGPAE